MFPMGYNLRAAPHVQTIQNRKKNLSYGPGFLLRFLQIMGVNANGMARTEGF